MVRHLTSVQREVLETLVNLYKEKGRMIKSKEVASILGKDEGTVRNIIMWLKSMGLVESRTGPAGGYVPTLKAYEALGTTTMIPTITGYGVVVVKKPEGELKLSAIQLEILGLFSMENAKAVVRATGNLFAVSEGDKVRIESIPHKRLVIEGYVEKKDIHAGEMMVAIQRLVVIPDEKVSSIATKKLITIPEDASLREAASILYKHGIRGAPVTASNGKVIGFITTTDVAMVVANNEDLDSPISEYMRRNVFVIGENESIIEAMRLMDFHGVGRLVVIDNKGNPIGIITRTDILRFILAL
ncbi:MAG: CBS domain-containing protein [Desulfurococcales archaeon]|nr:CBS domain-containing protein [Desulfurococcales archaeon]